MGEKKLTLCERVATLEVKVAAILSIARITVGASITAAVGVLAQIAWATFKH